jgi:hypothetical protein
VIQGECQILLGWWRDTPGALFLAERSEPISLEGGAKCSLRSSRILERATKVAYQRRVAGFEGLLVRSRKSLTLRERGRFCQSGQDGRGGERV